MNGQLRNYSIRSVFSANHRLKLQNRAPVMTSDITVFNVVNSWARSSLTATTIRPYGQNCCEFDLSTQPHDTLGDE